MINYFRDAKILRLYYNQNEEGEAIYQATMVRVYLRLAPQDPSCFFASQQLICAICVISVICGQSAVNLRSSVVLAQQRLRRRHLSRRVRRMMERPE